ncbi:protein PF3D7_1417600-like isoform X1 [Gordionus sp. m RMFG-2023]|uniref:protein PF3D7_1417600-like isoform X1 n=1 Tax=Gordionus sp. m RMFG-2023 TaxID=3053472 RepID=UPI0031FBA435
MIRTNYIRDLSKSCWPIYDKRQERDFNTIAKNWIITINQNEPNALLGHIFTSILVCPFHSKLYKFLAKFSRFIICHLLNKKHVTTSYFVEHICDYNDLTQNIIDENNCIDDDYNEFKLYYFQIKSNLKDDHLKIINKLMNNYENNKNDSNNIIIYEKKLREKFAYEKKLQKKYLEGFEKFSILNQKLHCVNEFQMLGKFSNDSYKSNILDGQAFSYYKMNLSIGEFYTNEDDSNRAKHNYMTNSTTSLDLIKIYKILLQSLQLLIKKIEIMKEHDAFSEDHFFKSEKLSIRLKNYQAAIVRNVHEARSKHDTQQNKLLSLQSKANSFTENLTILINEEYDKIRLDEFAEIFTRHPFNPYVILDEIESLPDISSNSNFLLNINTIFMPGENGVKMDVNTKKSKKFIDHTTSTRISVKEKLYDKKEINDKKVDLIHNHDSEKDLNIMLSEILEGNVNNITKTNGNKIYVKNFYPNISNAVSLTSDDTSIKKNDNAYIKQPNIIGNNNHIKYFIPTSKCKIKNSYYQSKKIISNKESINATNVSGEPITSNNKINEIYAEHIGHNVIKSDYDISNSPILESEELCNITMPTFLCDD